MMPNAGCRLGIAALATALTVGATGAVLAQDRWSVFDHRQGTKAGEVPSPPPPAQTEPARPGERPLLAPMDGSLGAPRSAQPDRANLDTGRGPGPSGPDGRRAGPVERTSLDPVTPENGDAVSRGAEPHRDDSGTGALVLGAWSGLDDQTLEKLFAGLDIPPASPAMAELWRKLLLTEREGDGRSDPAQFSALRAEALTRSGLFAEAADMLQRLPPQSAIAMVLKARNAVAVGDREAGCAEIGPLLARVGELPELLKEEGLLVSGYCAAAAGNPAAAGLAANLAREAGITGSTAVDALDAIAAGQVPPPPSKARMSPTEYRILETAGAADVQVAIDTGGPALLAAVAQSKTLDGPARLAASEAAAARNALAPQALAGAYRTFAEAPAAPDAGADLSLAASQAMRRAGLYAAAEREMQPDKKARLIQVYLEESRKAGLYWPSIQVAGPLAEGLAPDRQMTWFAETAVEIALAAGRADRARAWAEIGARQGTGAGGELTHWLALADITEASPTAQGGAGLNAVETLARNGRFDPALLHRLATVMEALDIDVPIGLWELASRAPQPEGGYLPQTGVLTELQNASTKRESGRTILLVLQAMGAQRAEGMHIIGLGDSIRALRRAGLDREARRVGFEALLAGWPRTVTN